MSDDPITPLSGRIEADYDSRGWAAEVRDLEDCVREAEAERDRLAAEVERLKYRLFFIEIEAGAMRRALSALVRQVEDSGLHLSSCIRTRYDTDDLPEGAECECFDPAMEEALAALPDSAGRRTLAQIEAGRQIAEAVRGYYTASVDGVVGVQAEDAMRAALAAWDRAAAGEGGGK